MAVAGQCLCPECGTASGEGKKDIPGRPLPGCGSEHRENGAGEPRDGGGPPRSGQRLPGPRAERRKAEGETPAGAFNIGTKATARPRCSFFHEGKKQVRPLFLRVVERSLNRREGGAVIARRGRGDNRKGSNDVLVTPLEISGRDD